MEYEIIDAARAVELRDQSTTEFVKNIDFNNAALYKLSNSGYLVMPVNLFAKSMVIHDRIFLEKCINSEVFPTNEPFNKFFFNNKEIIQNLDTNKDSLKRELFTYVYGKNDVDISNLSSSDIDFMAKTLKQKKQFENYRLNFIVVAGEFVMHKNKKQHFKFALIRNKQFLNPLVTIAIVAEENKNYYFDIEEKIVGKHGYLGADHILREASEMKRKANEIEAIWKVF